MGCYDNTVQLWNTEGKCLNSFPAHTGPVKAVCWAEKLNENKDMLSFLSASHDQSIIIWHFNKSKNNLERTDKCVGHSESVECIDVNSEKNKVNH